MIRGLRSQRPGMVESCDQYEFCYQLLEESLWGKSAKANTSTSPAKAKKSKFKLFKRNRYALNNICITYMVFLTGNDVM